MSDEPSVLYVAHGEGGETIRTAVERTGYASVETTGGLDALKRLAYEPVDAVVVPAALPDVPVDVFVGRLGVAQGTGPCIVVGDVDRVPGPMIQVAADVTAEALAARIERAIRDRRLGDELDRHDRLKNAFVRVAGATDDPEAIDRVLYEALADLGTYRFVLIGRYDPDGDAVDLRQPFHRRMEFEELGALLGETNGASVRRAIDEGDVTWATVSGPEGGAATAEAAGDLVLTTVPLADPDRTYGVVLLAADAERAPDGSERSLLSRIGRVCGLALGRDTADPDGTPDRTAGLVEVLAHELRNSLQCATISLEMARDDDAAAFDRLADALEGMDAIIDSTLSMASGGVEELVETDVHDVSVDVWHAIRTPRAELTIAQPATVEADPALLERLLSNLFRNAIDHAGPAVSVRVGALSGDRGFYVEDDGPGVPPEERDSVFEWGVTTAEEGLGIGLGFVREIAEAHGWTVSVTEGTDGGARFEVVTAERSEASRDELSALFSGDETEFVFPEERRAE